MKPISKQLWILIFGLSIVLSFANTIAVYIGQGVNIISLVIGAVVFVRLIFNILNTSITNLTIGFIKIMGYVLVAIAILGLIFGIVNGLLHLLLNPTQNRGQLETILEILMLLITWALVPVLIIVFFRFIDNKNLFSKIPSKTYFELVITLFFGTVCATFPTMIVLRTLFSTYLLQFFILSVMYALQATAIIITCKNRGLMR